MQDLWMSPRSASCDDCCNEVALFVIFATEDRMLFMGGEGRSLSFLLVGRRKQRPMTGVSLRYVILTALIYDRHWQVGDINVSGETWLLSWVLQFISQSFQPT